MSNSDFLAARDTWNQLEAKSKNLAYRLSDLTECSQERLASCGAVQSFALVFIVDIKNSRVLAVSENVSQIRGVYSAQELLGKNIDQLLTLPEMLAYELAQTSSASASLRSVFYACRSEVQINADLEKQYECSNCVRMENFIVYEFEKCGAQKPDHSSELLKNLVSTLDDTGHFELCCQSVASSLQKFSGIDRVMVYQFDEFWNGQVIAESKRTDLNSYLGLKYPASDIPPQARALYTQNQMRFIADSRTLGVPLVSREFAPADFDLSKCLSRAVSPFHLQYLQNMGVRSSFSAPILIAGGLWRLLSGHHYSEPFLPPFSMRSCLELGTRFLSGRLLEITTRRRLQIKSETLQVLQTLLNEISMGRELGSAFEASGEDLLKLTSSDSVYIKIAGQNVFIGKKIHDETLQKLLAHLENQEALSVWKSSCLKDDLKLEQPAESAAGALAVPLSLHFQDFIVWIRQEEVQEIKWGGRLAADGGANLSVIERLTPRSSFAEWRNEYRYQSRPWNEADDACAQYFLVGFVHEIFARAQAMSKAYQELERSGKAKDEFISTVSHELRTPLSVIIGWIDILKDYPQEYAEARQAIEIIERHSKSQVSLINDLLDMSRIMSGKMRIDIQREVNVAAVVSSVVEGLRPAILAKSLSLEWNFQDKIMVPADPDRLRQIVWNLITNAIKFTPKVGTIRIFLTQQHSSVTLEVQDSGVGIEPDQLQVIFNRFVQANNAAVKAGGLGLGLSLVKGLVELHGGRVSAQSPGKGQGSRFIVILPNYILPQSRPLPSGQFASALIHDKILGNLTLLVAEDEPDALCALKIACERRGARVKTAANGIEALEILKREHVDLILSDIGMPEMDGYVLLKTWREHERVSKLKPIPAIALTAYASSKDRIDAFNAGFMTHISKPIDRLELLAAIAKLKILTAPSRS